MFSSLTFLLFAASIMASYLFFSVPATTEIYTLSLHDALPIWIQVIDVKNMLGDSYKISLGDTDKKFRFVFKAENPKFIPQDYEVTITSKLMSPFKGTEVVDIDYWVATEKKPSSFEG